MPPTRSMANHCYEAAIELLVEVGVFNEGTERVIRFKDEQIRKGFSQLRDNLILSDGRERFLLLHRDPDVYNGPQKLDRMICYTWERERGGPSGEFEEAASAFV